jgi:hypothetical protein
LWWAAAAALLQALAQQLQALMLPLHCRWLPRRHHCLLPLLRRLSPG